MSLSAKSLSSVSFRTVQQSPGPNLNYKDVGVWPATVDEVEEDTVKMLTQRIADISARLVAKDELANQQARMAKEAVEDLIVKEEQLKHNAAAFKEEKAAREKAQADYHTVKDELEMLYQQKSFVEARMSQLNETLKERMDEMRHAEEWHEQKAHEVSARKREWDKLRNELETENAHLKRQLMEATAENAALSKSLRERAHTLAEVNESKTKVESESKTAQVQIESLHKDMDAYKYEIHLLKKELQIRNDEEQQLRKVANVTHKQHLENVKKIAKLDSECQRLRALIRKKLPGPAAIAQMRVEGDHVGKKKLPSLKQSANTSPEQRELEILTERVISMEDETKLLKEALAKRTAELHCARQSCARTVAKLSSAEGVLEAMVKGQEHEDYHRVLKSFKMELNGLQQQAMLSSPTSLTTGVESMEVDWTCSSEDGGNNDDELTSAESWASALITELSHFKKDDGSPVPDGTHKVHDKCKPAIIGLSRDFDLKTALQELSNKLSSIGENILALPWSMRCIGDQGDAGNAKSVHFGVLSQIMEEFTMVKQLLVELGKALELERNEVHVIDMDRSVQGSEASKIDGFSTIDECDDEANLQVACGSGKLTCRGVMRKVMEDLIELVERKRADMDVCGDGEDDLINLRLRQVVSLFHGEYVLREMSEATAAEIVCKLGDTLWGAFQSGKCEDAAASAMDSAGNGSAPASLVDDDETGGGCAVKDCDVNTDQLDNLERQLTTQRDEAEAKLLAAEAALEQQRGTAATLEAESLQLAEEKASLVQQLADMSTSKQRAEEDLAAARASLDELRQQVAATIAARCEVLESTSLSNAGTPVRARKSADGDADVKMRKGREIASAKAQLVECQRTILVLGNQLRALSSVQENTSFDSSLESAISTDHMNLQSANGAMDGQDVDSNFVFVSHKSSTQPAGPNAPQRRAQQGYVRTRGGRLVSTEQFWGSSGDITGATNGALVVHDHRSQGALPSDLTASRHVPGPRHLYTTGKGSFLLHSPLHEYATDPAAYVYSPPETALSSPARSPARFDLQLEHNAGRRKTPPAHGAATNKTVNESSGTGCPSPSPAKKVAIASRVARFFTRAKITK